MAKENEIVLFETEDKEITLLARGAPVAVRQRFPYGDPVHKKALTYYFKCVSFFNNCF